MTSKQTTGPAPVRPKKPHVRLKAWREHRAISQLAAAEELGVDQSTYSRWETDTVRPDLAATFRIEDETAKLGDEWRIPARAWA